MGKLPWSIPNFPKEEGERRHRAIKELMEFRGIDCLIIAGHQGNYGARTANFRYVSNYAMWFDDEYIVFPMEGEPFLICFNTAHVDWAKRICWIPVKTRGISGMRDYVSDLATAVKERGYEEGTLGIVDMETMPASIYSRLLVKLPKAKFVEAKDLLGQVRMVKSPAELAFMEKAGECADKGFEGIKATAKPGVKDREVWSAMESAMTAYGAEPPSFSLYASGPWEEKGINFPYGPVDRVLKSGDQVLNEITPSYGGYWAQLCRPVSLGKPADSFKKAFDVQVEMYNKTVELLRPGNVYGDIDAKMREIAAKNGYDPTNAFSLQHVGLDIIERIPKRTVLRPGMVLVNHPWIEFPPKKGEVGGHIIGDTYIITEGKPKCLSKVPFELVIV
jgi:Xaa-Pro aminopeptidase